MGVFGLRGEVKVRAADPAQLRARLQVIASLPEHPKRELVIASVRRQKTFAVVHFQDVGTADEARALVGAVLTIRARDAAKLGHGEYRDAQLIGLRVIDAAIGDLGEVVDVLHYPSADMLVVGPQRRLIPMLKAYGVRVDALTRTVHTNLPRGFEDL